MDKNINLNMTPLENMVFQILLNSKRQLSFDEICELSPTDHKWNNKSIYTALKNLRKKGLVEEAGKIKVARTRAILFRPTLTELEYYEASHREHFEKFKSGNVSSVLSALSSYKGERNQELVEEVEDWLQKQIEIERTKNNLK